MRMQLRDFNSNIINLDQLKQQFMTLWVSSMEDKALFHAISRI
jgi:hypothetical protein